MKRLSTSSSGTTDIGMATTMTGRPPTPTDAIASVLMLDDIHTPVRQLATTAGARRTSKKTETTQKLHDSRPIEIHYNCLLIPAVMLVWWYWMRRSARQVISRVVEPDRPMSADTHEGRGFVDEAEYSTWEEVIQNHKLDEHSTGFVRWIDNDNNLYTGDEESPQHKIIPASFGIFNTLSSPLSRRKQSKITTQHQSTGDDDDESSSISGVRWAVLPNRGIELDVVSIGEEACTTATRAAVSVVS